MTNNKDQASTLRKNNNMLKQNSKKAITCIAIASGKGGVGKTFLSVNLALAMHNLNKKTLLIDADLGLANLDIVLGVNPQYTLQEAIFQNLELKNIVTTTPYGIDLLAASSGTTEMVSIGKSRMSIFIQELINFSSNYDVIIFDCAAGINNSVTSFIAATPQTIVATTPQPTAIMDVYALLKVIHKENLTKDVGLILNAVENQEQGDKALKKLLNVTEKYLSLQITTFGQVPFSKAVSKAVHARKPLMAINPQDIATKKITEIAKTILQKQKATTRLRNFNVAGILDGILKG